jgi:hypothetical protein
MLLQSSWLRWLLVLLQSSWLHWLPVLVLLQSSWLHWLPVLLQSCFSSPSMLLVSFSSSR